MLALVAYNENLLQNYDVHLWHCLIDPKTTNESLVCDFKTREVS